MGGAGEGLRVWGVGYGVWGVGCGVWGVGCGVWGVGCGMWSVGCGVWDVGCGVWGVVRGGVWGFGSECRVQAAGRRLVHLVVVSRHPRQTRGPRVHHLQRGGCFSCQPTSASTAHALRMLLVTVPRVSRSCELFPGGLDHHLQRGPATVD